MGLSVFRPRQFGWRCRRSASGLFGKPRRGVSGGGAEIDWQLSSVSRCRETDRVVRSQQCSEFPDAPVLFYLHHGTVRSVNVEALPKLLRGEVRLRINHTVADGDGNCLDPVHGSELPNGIGHVLVYGPLGDVQYCADFPSRLALRNPAQNLQLTRRQPR